MKETALEINGLSKKIGDRIILSDINLSVKAGDICGIVGRNASGKSMLFKCITNLVTYDSGHITVLGQSSSYLGSISALIEYPGFISNYSGIKNLLTIASIRNVATKSDITTLMETLGIEPTDNKPYKRYSLGMRQKLGIVAAFMEKSPLIILDEPTNNVDAESVNAILGLIELYNKQYNTTFIITSHNKDEIERICTEIFVLGNGSIHRKEAI